MVRNWVIFLFIYRGGINYLFTHHWSDPPSNSGVKPVSPDIFVCSNSQGVLLEKHQLWCKTSIFQCGNLFTSSKMVCFNTCLFFVFVFPVYIICSPYIYIYIYNPKWTDIKVQKTAAATKTHGIQESLQLPPELPREIQAVQGLWQVKSGLRVRIDEDQVGGAGTMAAWLVASGVRQRKPRKKGVCPGSLKLVVGSLGLESWKIKIVVVNLLDSWYSIKWLEEKKH